MRPRLKTVLWERAGESLRVAHDRRDQLLVEDPTGQVEKLLELLREGTRTVEELAVEMGLSPTDLSEAVAEFDSCGLLEDADRLGRLTSGAAERHHSNLAFFESFATLARSREDFQLALRQAHVLVLGAGGLNANTVPHFCGLGIGRLTLTDRDTVEPRNFARQYLNRWEDIGASKVERARAWVRAYDPEVEVTSVTADVDGPETVARLLDEHRPDVVMAGIDQPAAVDLWVNAACAARRIPFVRAGMLVTEGLVYSVVPGVSACLACGPRSIAGAAPPEAGAARHPLDGAPALNRSIGPVAGLLGALAAFEVLRLLTGFEPPAHAGRPLSVDFASGCSMTRGAWTRDPACGVCGSGAPGGGAPVPDRRGGDEQ
ncbi:ThiF family adenylyltransferase [Kitasatospora sp. NPDC001664]